MLNRLKLGTQFILLLLLIFAVGSTIAGTVLFDILEQRAQDQITARGLVMMETINAVRDYTNRQIVPLLKANLDPNEFAPEIVPSYAAKTVFQLVHTNQDYADLSYKEAVLNPTNLNDKADAFETTVVDQFKAEPNTKQISGFRSVGNQRVFYSARPLIVRKASCLQCHSIPKAAPKSMLATYGEKNGFGWKLNSLIGAQMVYVPAEAVFQSARRAFLSVMSIVLGAFAIAVILLNQLLKPTVLGPVRHLAKLSQKLGAGEINPDASANQRVSESETQTLAKVATRRDELGQLAKVFQSMVREVVAREQRLRQQIHALRIEIDQSKKAREVAEITETDYFQELQKKAKEFRDQSNDER